MKKSGYGLPVTEDGKVLSPFFIMAFASLYIGDSQTMAAEAGVLGVPFVRFNDFVGRIGYLRELEDVYQLGFGVHASPLSPFSVGQKLPKIDQQLLLEENQKNNKKIEESSDTCSISNNLNHMSAQEQALGQPSAQSCSIDSVAQTLSNDSSTKKPKNISFTNAPQAKNDKNVIYRLDGTVQPSGVEALIETVEALVGMDAEERQATFQERRQTMLNDKIDCAQFLTWFIENYPQSVSETKAADSSFWERFK